MTQQLPRLTRRYVDDATCEQVQRCLAHITRPEIQTLLLSGYRVHYVHRYFFMFQNNTASTVQRYHRLLCDKQVLADSARSSLLLSADTPSFVRYVFDDRRRAAAMLRALRDPSFTLRTSEEATVLATSQAAVAPVRLDPVAYVNRLARPAKCYAKKARAKKRQYQTPEAIAGELLDLCSRRGAYHKAIAIKVTSKKQEEAIKAALRQKKAECSFSTVTDRFAEQVRNSSKDAPIVVFFRTLRKLDQALRPHKLTTSLAWYSYQRDDKSSLLHFIY